MNYGSTSGPMDYPDKLAARSTNVADILEERVSELRAAICSLEHTVSKMVQMPPATPTTSGPTPSTAQMPLPLFERIERENTRLGFLTDELRGLTNLLATRV